MQLVPLNWYWNTSFDILLTYVNILCVKHFITDDSSLPALSETCASYDTDNDVDSSVAMLEASVQSLNLDDHDKHIDDEATDTYNFLVSQTANVALPMIKPFAMKFKHIDIIINLKLES